GDNECHLVAGGYAYLLQMVLGFAALAGLLVKRWRAPVKRLPLVWLYDVSKQGFGSVFVHMWNIILSIILADLRSGATDTDECAMYFVNFFLDIAFGTFILWCFIKVQEFIAHKLNIESLRV
ncbi:unnamed protein product, partial [Discosporangium mesarthrocarpum]